MYHHVITVKLTPGKRFAGIDLMKELGAHLEKNYGVQTQVLSNESGNPYQHHMVTTYESLAQYEDVFTRLFQDETYIAWFGKMTEGKLVKWDVTEMRMYRVM